MYHCLVHSSIFNCAHKRTVVKYMYNMSLCQYICCFLSHDQPYKKATTQKMFLSKRKKHIFKKIIRYSQIGKLGTEHSGML